MIKVIDSIMGSGKTSWAIAEMNAHPEQRYLYVTPYLAEAERILRSCPALHFALPTEEISKAASLQMLVADGRNVAITHALFSRMKLSSTLYSDLRQYGYTLIMDEEVEIIEPINVTKQDVDLLFAQRLIDTDDNGQVRWIDNDYQGKFSFLKRMAKSKTLVWFENVLFLWVFPVEILQAFTDIFILTFLFEGSHLRSFLDLHSLPFLIYHVANGHLTSGKEDLTATKMKIRKLLHVYAGT